MSGAEPQRPRLTVVVEPGATGCRLEARFEYPPGASREQMLALGEELLRALELGVQDLRRVR